MTAFEMERTDTVVIGGGQAGLSVGYHLARRGVPFVILDAGQRVGDTWRNRWDSLRLFTPAKFSGLDGMPFPAHGDHYPTKDEMADYLEAYAQRFDLPIRAGVEVDRLCRRGEHYIVAAGDSVIEADNVVVAMANQMPRIPESAAGLGDEIFQIHSRDYRNPSQLRDGPTLVVGAGNSGVEIAIEIASEHRVWLAGDYPGYIPFRIESFLARKLLVRLVVRVVFHRILTERTPVGRRFREKKAAHGRPLVRTKPKDVAAAGVEQVPRVTGVRDGLPLLADGRTLEVANVIWCTGYEPALWWVDIDVLEAGLPRHHAGIVEESPGLYFIGLEFLYAASSEQIHGVGRDAARVAKAVAARAGASGAVRAPYTTA